MVNNSGIDFRSNDISSLVQRVHLGELHAHELVQHALERIDALNKTINAFVAVNGEAAYEEAIRIDALIAAGQEPGPLAGIPLAVKDLEDAFGYVTTLGSEVLSSGRSATSDSLLVARLKAAGAIVIGKTNTPELGWKGLTDNTRFGSTTNPWSVHHSPGGSSGGSAAAIAAGMVPLATGSDGGGSIRIPSAWCGITGFKPSLGRIPDGPGLSVGWRELSCKGVMAKNISGILEAFVSVAGPDDRDFTSLPSACNWQLARDPKLPKRIAWSPTLGYASVDPSILDVCQDAVQLIAQCGVDVEEVSTVFSHDPAPAFHTLTSAYNLRTVGHLQGTDSWALLDPELALSVEPALAFRAVDIVAAEDTCDQFNHDLAHLFTEFEMLITPTCAAPPPPAGSSALSGHLLDLSPYPFTHPFNLTRSPAATIFAGLDRRGLPVGIQIVGRMHDDIGILRATAAIEALLAARPTPLRSTQSISSGMH